jgi:hypothetical protein
MPEVPWDGELALKPTWGMTASMVTGIVSMGNKQIRHNDGLTTERVYVALQRGASVAIRVVVAVALFL